MLYPFWNFSQICKYCQVSLDLLHSGVELKFTEPLDSCFPETLWQIFPFKGTDEFGKLEMIQKLLTWIQKVAFSLVKTYELLIFVLITQVVQDSMLSFSLETLEFKWMMVRIDQRLVHISWI